MAIQLNSNVRDSFFAVMDDARKTAPKKKKRVLGPNAERKSIFRNDNVVG